MAHDRLIRECNTRFMKTLIAYSLAFIWLYSALCSAFLFSHEKSYELLSQVGIPVSWQPITLYSACLLDAVLGMLMLFQYQVKRSCYLQIAVIVIYSMIIAWKLPEELIHPFAPIAKNVPLVVLILVMINMDNSLHQGE